MERMGGRHVARTWLVVALIAATTSALAHASGSERELAPVAPDARAARVRSQLEKTVAAFGTSLETFEAGDKYRQHPEKREVRRPPAVAAKLDVVPWVQPQSGGVTIAGWF
jgi:hypothetical protein